MLGGQRPAGHTCSDSWLSVIIAAAAAGSGRHAKLLGRESLRPTNIPLFPGSGVSGGLPIRPGVSGGCESFNTLLDVGFWLLRVLGDVPLAALRCGLSMSPEDRGTGTEFCRLGAGESGPGFGRSPCRTAVEFSPLTAGEYGADVGRWRRGDTEHCGSDIRPADPGTGLTADFDCRVLREKSTEVGVRERPSGVRGRGDGVRCGGVTAAEEPHNRARFDGVTWVRVPRSAASSSSSGDTCLLPAEASQQWRGGVLRLLPWPDTGPGGAAGIGIGGVARWIRADCCCCALRLRVTRSALESKTLAAAAAWPAGAGRTMGLCSVALRTLRGVPEGADGGVEIPLPMAAASCALPQVAEGTAWRARPERGLAWAAGVRSAAAHLPCVNATLLDFWDGRTLLIGQGWRTVCISAHIRYHSVP